MSNLSFLDTNIFGYAAPANPAKQDLAPELIHRLRKQSRAVVSLQVMQEYFASATRKLGISPAIAQRKVELMGLMHVVRFQPGDVIAAIELHRLHSISFWDAMVVHAAKLSGARTLYSEDFQHGRTFGALTIVNPFNP